MGRIEYWIKSFLIQYIMRKRHQTNLRHLNPGKYHNGPEVEMSLRVPVELGEKITKTAAEKGMELGDYISYLHNSFLANSLTPAERELHRELMRYYA